VPLRPYRYGGRMAALPLETPIFRREDGMKTIERTRMLVKTFAAVAASAVLISVAASPAAAQHVRWHHIIGIKQAGNMVGNITGGGQPWSASGGHARVDLATGNMEFEVNGLVLAGGDSIGTPGPVTQVVGTLVCAASSATPVVISSPAVSLSLQGEAFFYGNIGTIPTTCNSSNVAFLIEVTAGRWIANGAVITSP
jgi:hypothetical protein